MPTKEPVPIDLPAEIWTRPDVLAMCRRRDAHAILALVNSSKYRITQTQLAYWMNVETGVVNKIVNGKSGPVVRLDKWEKIADALHMPDEVRIALGLAPKNYSKRSASSVFTHEREDELSNPSEDEYSATDAATRPTGDGSSSKTLDDGAAVLRGFTSALSGPGLHDAPTSQAGDLADIVQELRNSAISHRQAYRYMSHEVLLPQALAHIDAVVSLRPGAQSPSVRASLVSTVGEMAALVGTLASLDMHDYRHGNIYLSMALSAAQEAKNKDLLAFTLGARAFHAAYSGNLDDGIDFVEGGLSEASVGGSPTTRAWLAAVASELHATDNNDYRCRTLLDDSREILRENDDQPWVGVGLFNDAKLRAYRGGNLNRLGRYVEAQSELAEALRELPTTAFKHRATASIDLAEAHLPARELEEACSYAIQALGLTNQTQHTGTLQRIKSLYRSARVIDKNFSSVRALGDRLLISG